MQGQSGGIEPIGRPDGKLVGEVKGGLAAGGLSSAMTANLTGTGNGTDFLNPMEVYEGPASGSHS